MKTTITIGFSPCPNDTFIFDALVNHKIDTENFLFEPVLEDVQTLNDWALSNKLMVSKISYAVLPLVLKNYELLSAGGALGKAVGPLLIANHKVFKNKNIDDQLIALPGENTTAHLLFSMAYPNAKNKVFLKYHQIESFVQEGKGLGVIIHENRFTYEAKGLKKIVDLGDFWEQQTSAPIPLGGIVVNRNLPHQVKIKINHFIAQSVQYSFSRQPELSNYIKSHAQEMDPAVMQQHIDLYVNDFTKQLGPVGQQAVLKLLSVYEQLHPTEKLNVENIFLAS